MKNRFLGILLAGVMACVLTACGSTTTDLTGDVSEEDTVEDVEIVEEEPVVEETVEEEPVIEAPVEETVVDDVVDDETVVDDEKLVYVNETLATWGDDSGICYMYEREDGLFDFMSFKADLVRDGGHAEINKAYEGASFTVALDVTQIQSAPLERYVGITDGNFDLIIWIAYDESDALTIDTNAIMGVADKYQEVSDGHFVVAYTDTIGEDVAQEVLDSCVYYDNEEDIEKQFKAMEDSVTK